MAENIRPLAAKGKGKAVIIFNYAEPGPEYPVNPGDHVLPKKGMQDLGRHGLC
jgi:hypothetical protein